MQKIQGTKERVAEERGMAEYEDGKSTRWSQISKGNDGICQLYVEKTKRFDFV